MSNETINLPPTQTFGELMGFKHYTAEDFIQGDCFFIDQARQSEQLKVPAIYPRLVVEGAKTYRELTYQYAARTALQSTSEITQPKQAVA